MGQYSTLGGPGLHPAHSVHSKSVNSRCNVNIGASGAPTLVGPLGWGSFVRAGAGSYTAVCPALTVQAKSIPILRGGVLVSAAKTVSKVIITAYDPTTGVFAFTTALTAGTAADPANGDILWFELEGSTGGTQ